MHFLVELRSFDGFTIYAFHDPIKCMFGRMVRFAKPMFIAINKHTNTIILKLPSLHFGSKSIWSIIQFGGCSYLLQ
uniref:Uncharacterized protein n=1 Tax=Rhizophora mucronata TaxID=61149 RepID=A0A2P2JIG2_RHIMU